MRQALVAVLATCIALTSSACSRKSPGEPVAASSQPKASAAPVVATPSLTTKPFEGEIQIEVRDQHAKEPETFTYDIKETKVTYAPTNTAVTHEPATRTLSDLKTEKVFGIVPKEKTFVEMDRKVGAPPASVTKLGKMENVAGYACEDWRISSGEEQVDVCVAKGVPYFDLSERPHTDGTEPSWAAALTKENAFPLRAVAHDKMGKEEFRAEAKKVELKTLDKKIFDVPADYRKVTLTKEMKFASIP